MFKFGLDIGGLEDMKLIYGTTVARKKGKAEKEDKVKMSTFSFLFFLVYFFGQTQTYLF